jgi:geranylgeranylglycerol-phosphate geranylgeranyltransferase
MGATMLYFLVGVSTGEAPATGRVVVWSLVMGALFHVYADVGNDVMDLPIDRTDPRRATSPLARGAITPQWALAAALAMLPLMFATLLFAETRSALGPVVTGTLLIGIYNVVGKVLAVPLVADVVQGIGWAALVVAGAFAAGGATTATIWASLAVVVYITMVNGLHGAIRDSVNDDRAGARTTALMLGAHVAGGRSVVVPPRVVAWGAALQVGFGLALAGFLSGVGVEDAWQWSAAAGAALVLYATSCVVLARAYRARSDLRQAMALGTWHLFLLPASLLAASTRLMPGWMIAATFLAFLLPPLIFGWAVRGSEFGMPSTSAPEGADRSAPTMPSRVAALWEMTRPGTWFAAAVLVAVGATLSGALELRVLPLMAATACAVAAANVFNDRCDEVADAVNRPDRPLISGAATGNDADKFVLAAALGSVGASAVLGSEASLATTALLLGGLLYSLVLRRVVFLGQVTVAALFAAPVVYGAWLAGNGVATEHWIATVLVMLYIFARETLKGVPDRLGDVAAGYRTPATSLGEAGALIVFRWSSALFCVASPAAYLFVDNVPYLVASLLCAIAPALRTVRMVRGVPSVEAVNKAVAFSGLVFASGLVPLLLLT